eukprot:TRINITY_DN846_c0_g1_i2.p1 TRINITY_DN846_c0_g1~~TRINITY_DN846_c0_g1_i2.p1  ORF type:complete len:977 (+),score=278.62 TRINITY_DN846_c0_g1_i2:170-3100(+)
MDDFFSLMGEMVFIDNEKEDSPKQTPKSESNDENSPVKTGRKASLKVDIDDYLRKSPLSASPKMSQQKEYELSNSPHNVPFPTKGRIVTFGTNSSGTIVALGGKQLFFVDLFSGKEIFKTSPGNFDFSVAEWSHTRNQRDLLASACSTEATVFKLNESSGKVSVLAKLPYHKRAIADIDWNRHQSDLLATCAADGCVALWDLREPRRPSKVFKTQSSAPTKVQWNYQVPSMFATANGGEIKIWDIAKESPVESILAHASPINGMDWSPRSKFEILSYSQDRTVKFWNSESKSEPKFVLNVGAPIVSASYCPFGRAVSTISKGENMVKLWNLSDLSFPVYTYGGPEGLSKLQWITTQDDGSVAYDAVALCKDHSLKVWKVGKYAQKISKGIPPPLQTRRMGENSILDLSQEFALLVKHGITGVIIKELSLEKRFCNVSAKAGEKLLDLQINFPAHYPHGASPTFTPLGTSEGLPVSVLTNLRKILTDTAAQLTNRHRPCLEECLSKMVLLLKARSEDSLSEKSDENLSLSAPSFSRKDELPAGILTYVVKVTDTLSGIALTHDMTREQVRQANQLFSAQLIPGTTLYLKDPNNKESKNVTQNQILECKKAHSRRSAINHTGLVSSAPVTQLEETAAEKKATNDEGEPRKSLDYSFGQMQGRLAPQAVQNKKEEAEEIVRETTRYCSDDFNVEGILTLTSNMVIFEPNLVDQFVIKNGVLPYQLVIQMKNIFDTQIIGEDARYFYEDSLEISVLDQDQVRIYDFLVNPKRLNNIYKKIIQTTSTTQGSHPSSQVVKKSEAKESKSGFVPSLDKESVLLTSDHREQLARRLPARYRLNDWKLAYSTQAHGISLKTFFGKTENAGANFIVIEDSRGWIFGGFASEAWRVEPRFYGNGECFVFQLNPTVDVWDWSEINSNFMCSRRDFIAMGGGPMFSFWLDSDLNNGSSNACETFKSPTLSSSEDFQISVVEVWSVSNSL